MDYHPSVSKCNLEEKSNSILNRYKDVQMQFEKKN